MKVIKLNHNSRLHADKEFKKHSKLCELHKQDGNYIIHCRCDEVVIKDVPKVVKPVVKVVKPVEFKSTKEIIDDIDADGNGHITKEEVKDYFNKK